MANTRLQKQRKYHIIYQTKNTQNGKIYIGAHSTDDLDDGYYGSGKNLSLAIKKYGKDAFIRTILHILTSPEEMFAKEKSIVTAEFIKRRDVYNIVEGGYGGENKGAKGLKHMYHPESGERIAVHLIAIEKMIGEGWVLGRKTSSTTDTIWIYKDDNKKMILPESLNDYISDGWIQGMPKSPTKGKVWIYNPATTEFSMCNKGEIPTGWIKKKWAPVKKGSTWVNNGSENLRIDQSLLDDYLSNGWTKGMITTRWLASEYCQSCRS